MASKNTSKQSKGFKEKGYDTEVDMTQTDPQSQNSYFLSCRIFVYLMKSTNLMAVIKAFEKRPAN